MSPDTLITFKDSLFYKLLEQTLVNVEPEKNRKRLVYNIVYKRLVSQEIIWLWILFTAT